MAPNGPGPGSPKALWLVTIFALVGTVLALLLFIDHLYPGSRLLPCAEGVWSGCGEVNRSEFSEILGLPVAAYGVIYFLAVFMAGAMVTAGRGRYERVLVLVAQPMAVIALAVDLGLAYLMIRIGALCQWCLMSYGANLVILVGLTYQYRCLKKTGQVNRWPADLVALRRVKLQPDQKALWTTYGLAVVLAALSLAAITIVFENNRKDFTAFLLREYYTSRPEPIAWPTSRLITGSRQSGVPVEMEVFTDFLCPPCARFFKIEEELLKKHPGRIRIVHYNFPLDKQCNPRGPQVHAQACLPARAAIAAAELGEFEKFVSAYFSRFPEWQKKMSDEHLSAFSATIMDPFRFQQAYQARTTAEILQRDIALGHSLNVFGTPTIFINGILVRGGLNKDLIEQIVQRAIDRNK